MPFDLRVDGDDGEGTVPHSEIQHRPIQLEWPDDMRTAWQPLKPEFAAACNGLSIGMPYGEPYAEA